MFRFYIFVCLHLFYLPSAAQTNEKTFVLNGMVKGRDTGIIILYYSNYNKEIIRDTSYLKSGSFTFIGKLTAPTFCWLTAKGEGNTTSLFVEPKEQ